MAVGAFQFRGTGDPSTNVRALERGIREAASRGVRFLLTQECALSGYAPLEVASSGAVDQPAQRAALRRVRELAQEHAIFVAVGLTTFDAGRARNSVHLVTPQGGLRAAYHKRALYGWDEENYWPDTGGSGLYVVDGVRVGVRICYEVRFPEYFRELFRAGANLAAVPFADVGGSESKYNVVMSHLISRAAENAVHVLSANSVSDRQGAPTCLIDPDGRVLAAAPRENEALIVGRIELGPPPFGRRGRIRHSSELQ